MLVVCRLMENRFNITQGSPLPLFVLKGRLIFSQKSRPRPTIQCVSLQQHILREI